MNRISNAYESLLEAFGPQDWWPSESTFETAVGAVLTQATAWTNAERAISRLREAGALRPGTLFRLEPARLRDLITPAGFSVRKAETLLGLAALAEGSEAGWSDLVSLGERDLLASLRSVRGIGPETADAIALYAAGHATFVVDAYTRRFAERHALAREGAEYDELKRLFEESLPRDARLYGEYHALLVALGKRHCRKVPLCEGCPLAEDLPIHEGLPPCGGTSAFK